MDINKRNMKKELENYFDEATQNHQKKFWKYKYKGNDLSTLLQSLNLEQLSIIGSTLDIPNRSKLRKAELIELIRGEIMSYIVIRMGNFNEKHIKLIQKILNNGGNHPYLPLEMQLIDYLFDCGIVFPVMKDTERLLVIPNEFSMLFKELKKELEPIIKTNSEVINTTYGLLHYYGVLPVMTWFDMIQGFFPSLKIAEIMSIVSTEMDCFNRIKRYSYYIASSSIDPEDLDSIIEKQNEKEYDYFSINKFRAIQASPIDYLEKTPQVNKLMKFITTRFDVSQDDLDEMIGEMVDMIKAGFPTSVYLKEFSEQFEFEDFNDIQELASLVMDIHNHTRMWELKGHTPNEAGKLMGFEMPTIPGLNTIPFKSTKVGRNDPCPCGSGKKYKHCCIDKE